LYIQSAMLFTATIIIKNLSTMKTSQSQSKSSFEHVSHISRAVSRGEKYGNREKVDKWHACHIRREAVGMVILALNNIFHIQYIKN
jgi:hypothetical protein